MSLACLSIAAPLAFAFAADPAADDRPNIVIILADDMGFSDVGCHGSEIPTPHIDSLAARGVRFTQFYNCGRCCPTRASLLTGLYPHQAGIGYMEPTNKYNRPIARTIRCSPTPTPTPTACACTTCSAGNRPWRCSAGSR